MRSSTVLTTTAIHATPFDLAAALGAKLRYLSTRSGFGRLAGSDQLLPGIAFNNLIRLT